MSDESPNLRLPYILPSQAQKHVTHNEAIRILDGLVQLAVLDRDLASPPDSPGQGDRYVVAAPGSGAWTGHATEIAMWQDGAWAFAVPLEGWLAWIADEAALTVFDGADWVAAAVASVNPVAMVGINTTADASNRLSLKSDASLFDHNGDDHRIKVNKAAASDTVSLLFQTNYSGRAELGTTGNDNLHIKVSADGSTWKTGMVIDHSTAHVGFGTDAPEGPLHILRTGTNPIHERVDSTANGPSLASRKARGTPGSKSAVVSGDVVQAFFGQGHDGSAYVACANLRWVVDGTVSSGVIPTRAEFWTFSTGGSYGERMRITPAGDLGVGITAPTARIHADGPVRVGQYAKASLPSASGSGAGSIVHVTDETGGAVLAFSDGSNWRRVTDRTVVS
ncbi:MAG: DUF2793 domain-containing protein [Rhizobiaceae bacterium]|nr:DUF2793 domain-containing protein [Rhizobiaceae bacterium]